MEARFYEKRDNRKVRCFACAQHCVIAEGKTGLCGVRRNERGTLMADFYGSVIARNVDPIEKKPLFHVLPGSMSYSIATSGCNFHCDFCQNAEISQNRLRGITLQPADVVAAARENGCRSVAYTYTEPTVFIEMALDVAGQAHDEGLYNVFVTNGYESPEVVAAMKGLIDAANVDLKSFRDAFYRTYCGAHLTPVIEGIKTMYDAGIFLEITTLVIPGKNDSQEELGEIAAFIAGVDPSIPWHISRFHPCYQLMDAPVTPKETLLRAYETGRQAGLHHVYIGNLAGSGYEDTICPGCGEHVIRRMGYLIQSISLKGRLCAQCGAEINLFGVA